MSCKKISAKTVYSVEIDQDQLDKLHAILDYVNDIDLDRLYADLEPFVDAIADVSGGIYTGTATKVTL